MYIYFFFIRQRSRGSSSEGNLPRCKRLTRFWLADEVYLTGDFFAYHYLVNETVLGKKKLIKEQHCGRPRVHYRLSQHYFTPSTILRPAPSTTHHPHCHYDFFTPNGKCQEVEAPRKRKDLPPERPYLSLTASPDFSFLSAPSASLSSEVGEELLEEPTPSEVSGVASSAFQVWMVWHRFLM